jgi:hypothetical protein
MVENQKKISSPHIVKSGFGESKIIYEKGETESFNNFVRIFPFNIYLNAAKRFVPYFFQRSIKPALMDDQSQTIHLLLIGYGTMGEEIVKEVIGYWRTWYQDSDRKDTLLKITFIDMKDSDDKRIRLIEWMKEKQYFSWKIMIESYDMKIPSAQFLYGDWIEEIRSSLPTLCVICLSNPTTAFTAALELSHIFEKEIGKTHEDCNKIPDIYIRLIKRDGVEEFIDTINNIANYSHLIPYTIVESGVEWNDEMEKRFPVKES